MNNFGVASPRIIKTVAASSHPTDVELSFLVKRRAGCIAIAVAQTNLFMLNNGVVAEIITIFPNHSFALAVFSIAPFIYVCKKRRLF